MNINHLNSLFSLLSSTLPCFPSGLKKSAMKWCLFFVWWVCRVVALRESEGRSKQHSDKTCTECQPVSLIPSVAWVATQSRWGTSFLTRLKRCFHTNTKIAPSPPVSTSHLFPGFCPEDEQTWKQAGIATDVQTVGPRKLSHCKAHTNRHTAKQVSTERSANTARSVNTTVSQEVAQIAAPYK